MTGFGTHSFRRPHAPLIVIPNHPILRAAHGGDSPQTIAGGHEIPKASLPEFRDTIHFRELKRFIFVPSLTDFTSVGETVGLVDLCQMFFRAGAHASSASRAYSTSSRLRTTTWSCWVAISCGAGGSFLNVEGFHFQDGVILNSSPQPGEKALYKPEFDPVTNELTRDYALV